MDTFSFFLGPTGDVVFRHETPVHPTYAFLSFPPSFQVIWITTFCTRELEALRTASILGGTLIRAFRKEEKDAIAGVPILQRSCFSA
jgi:hypothetical protein